MLISIKENFKNNKIDKQDFINQMYDTNSILFEYSKLIGDTDIKSIEITPNGVLFTSKEDEIKLFCDKNDKRTAPFEIMNFDTYESDDAFMLYELINDGDNIFDVGANIGWYSMSIAKKYPNSVINSFEPIPNTFINLNRNVKLNKFKNIKVHNFGFSDTEKQLEFFVSNKTSVSSSAANIASDNDFQKIICSVKSMDEYFENESIKIDFIKCDVEGAELFVFEGGIKTIDKYKPIIFSEMLRKWSAKFNYHPNNIIQLFQSINYQCFIINNHKYLSLIHEVNDRTSETNFFFLHSCKHQAIINKYAI